MSNRLSSEELKKFYEGEYVSAYEIKPLSRLLRLLPYFELAPADHVVDFACGNGMLLDLLHNKVASYTGIDFSEEFIASAKIRANQIGATSAEFICGDIVTFCNSHLGMFDKAFTMDFSEHIYDDDFVTIYSAIRGSLKPGGRLFLHTPNRDYIVEILKARGIMKQFPEHIGVRNDRQYQELLRQAGFNSVTVHHLPHYLPPLSYLHLFSFLPFIGKYFKARIFIVCQA
jgi:2-polyprenyl-3-methyl-5-hydroxy-6-metoxy-1,4-benzoquinol methylase